MDHYFCKEWREGNFTILVTEEFRQRELERMREALASGRGQDPENAAAAKALRQRIAALEVYDETS